MVYDEKVCSEWYEGVLYFICGVCVLVRSTHPIDKVNDCFGDMIRGCVVCVIW